MRRAVIFKLGLAFALISLITMILIDRALGSRAEFLNAWSVIERLFGRSPSTATSFVASHLGPVGEFLIVILANLFVGLLLARLIFWLIRII
jgi:hypothetical protein